MFRGNSPARIDDKGRLKIPNAFRSLLESKYGRELFLTSLSKQSVQCGQEVQVSISHPSNVA